MGKRTAKADWKNRIVGHADVDPKKIVANPLNYKVHSVLQERTLEGAIREIGCIRSVTINKRTGRLVDGHLRVTLALKRKIKSVPVEYVDLSEKEERAALACLDPLVKLAGEDDDKVRELANALGDDTPEIRTLIEGLVEDDNDEPPQEDEKVSFHVKADTLIKIGTYRFPIKRRAYEKWMNKIKAKTGHDEDSVIAELKKRLGL